MKLKKSRIAGIVAATFALAIALSLTLAPLAAAASPSARYTGLWQLPDYIARLVSGFSAWWPAEVLTPTQTPSPAPTPTPQPVPAPVSTPNDGIAAALSPAQQVARNSVTQVMLAAGTKYATPLYVIDSGKPGPSVMIIGGTHGSEPAGWLAAAKVKDLAVTKGKLLVIPNANKLADEARQRAVDSGDLNRQFPTSADGQPTSELAAAIWSAIESYRPDWLVDMHEAYDFHLVDQKALGSTVITYPNVETDKVADLIIANENKAISAANQKFTRMHYPLKGSIARAAGQWLGIRAMTFETSVKQPQATRINQHLIMVHTILSYLGME